MEYFFNSPWFILVNIVLAAIILSALVVGYRAYCVRRVARKHQQLLAEKHKLDQQFELIRSSVSATRRHAPTQSPHSTYRRRSTTGHRQSRDDDEDIGYRSSSWDDGWRSSDSGCRDDTSGGGDSGGSCDSSGGD